MRWREEIDELHQFFQAYFLGTEHSLARVDEALAADFTMVGAHGGESSRLETMRALEAGHGHSNSLRITTSDHGLLAVRDKVLVATYIEHHELRDRSNHRRSTVVFETDDSAPNGLSWVRVHETWIVES